MHPWPRLQEYCSKRTCSLLQRYLATATLNGAMTPTAHVVASGDRGDTHVHHQHPVVGSVASMALWGGLRLGSCMRFKVVAKALPIL